MQSYTWDSCWHVFIGCIKCGQEDRLSE
uniref:Macaca fascicularis brain cDNA clone: QflA-19035, similar to human SET translocation (myeloid leukemia-associated) (SET), mRNA, RefSeq: NM_003011.1 n=1 Tax=Macaca fascicularis TaxID=9541 RepID=I7G604_MACFA|nr:unnamed protein product [Macaca fascicularis]